MRKTHKRSRYYKLCTRKKGSGLTQSKPSSMYPPLPESPTNRPKIEVSNEKLEKVSGNERIKRLLPLAKRLKNVRQQTWKSQLLIKEKLNNSSNESKSAFNINKNNGFKSKS
jgi:hypothetical protein